MSDRYVDDTNILTFAHESAALAKHEAAKVLLKALWHDRTASWARWCCRNSMRVINPFSIG
jgi:hypothetical protein